MKRLLVSVGCDSYDFMEQLTGAENDASAVHIALGECGSYDSHLLLRSPSLSELQSGLSNICIDDERIDVITFFFAGHGAVKAGSFWMCLEDSHPSKLSTSAYSLSALLQFIQEVNPRHANIVVDACESGGVLGDVRSALRAHDFGDAGTTEISLLAACAKDQYAGEQDGAGICTSVILRCISGELFIQDVSADLDLAEIAKKVAQSSIEEQNPVFWGLNLSIRAPFCKNPNYSHEGPLRQAISVRDNSEVATENRRAIRKAYADLHERWDPRSFRSSLSQLLDGQGGVRSRLELLGQVSAAFTLEASASSDIFREVEVHAACLSVLLPHCSDQEIAAYAMDDCGRLCEKIFQCVRKVADALEENRYALLGRSAVPELFFLPLRIAKLLGWLGAAMHLSLDLGKSVDDEVVSRLLPQVLDLYSLSCSSMSEQQAPYAMAAITGLSRAGYLDEAEVYCSLLFKSLCDVAGNIAEPSAGSRQIIEYLVARAFGDFSGSDGLVARPSELAMLLLLSAPYLGLADVFDESMIELDRVSVNAFLPGSYMEFGEEKISKGRNFTFKIGFDVWTIDEIFAHWQSLPKPIPENPAVLDLSLVSSLIFPDRVCWHLIGGT